MNYNKEFSKYCRVLLVDEDVRSLEILGNMLQECQVIKCKGGEEALLKLHEDKDGYNMVIAAARMVNMDGFQLLRQIQNMNLPLPVILFSNKDETEDLVKRAIEQGACDFMIKPDHVNVVKLIWKHIFGDKIISINTNFQKQSISKAQFQEHTPREVEIEEASPDMSKPRKKPRLVWTPELKQKFEEAVIHLGIKNAVPKNILAYMQKLDVPDSLNRQHISSHLQKFRENWKKSNECAPKHLSVPIQSQPSFWTSTILPPPGASHPLRCYGTNNVSQPEPMFHNQVYGHPCQPSHGFGFGHSYPQANKGGFTTVNNLIMNSKSRGTRGTHIPNYVSCSRTRLMPQQRSVVSMSESDPHPTKKNNFVLEKESFECKTYCGSAFPHGIGLQPIFPPSSVRSSNPENNASTLDNGNDIGDATTEELLDSFLIDDPYFQHPGDDSPSLLGGGI